MATTPAPAPSPKFVTAAQVVKDIRSLLTEGPFEIADELRSHLTRESLCDFSAQTVSSINSDVGDSLAQVIRTHVRGTTGDGTQLKAANRLYINPMSLGDKNSNLGIARTGSQLSYPLSISYDRNVVRHRSTLEPCFTRSGNVLTFTRKAKLMVISQLNWGNWSGADKWDAPTVDPSWRFNAGGNNRTVTSSLNFLFTGNFGGSASNVKVLPQTVFFYEEEIYPASVRQLVSVTEFTVKDPELESGEIEQLSLEIERSPYVISYGSRTDHMGFFKTTGAGIEDTSNYIEIIEL